MDKILIDIRNELKQNIDEHTKKSIQHFFKEKVKFYGIKTAVVTRISKTYFEQMKLTSKEEIFKICDKLFSTEIIEESFIACNWSYYIREQFEEKDFTLFENWLNTYIHNWASCDTLCNHTIGAFLEIYPEYVEKIKEWTKSSNRWLRRASAVSLIIPGKKGKFLRESLDIADALIKDSDDLVQKGFGWLLKEESRIHQKEIFYYVLKNKDIMPRTALRYAIEKMPNEFRAKVLKK